MHRMSVCRNQIISVTEDQRVALLGDSEGSGLSMAEFRQRREVGCSTMAAAHGQNRRIEIPRRCAGRAPMRINWFHLRGGDLNEQMIGC
jgi:hypothetical protein